MIGTAWPFLISMILTTLTMASFSAQQEHDRQQVDRALREAVLSGTAREVSDELALGADSRRTDRFGTTLLMHAAVRGKLRVAEMLLAAGADPHARNEDDETALFFAARGCSEPIARLLLAHRVDVNVSNQQRETPLMIAAENGCATVVRALLTDPKIDLFAQDEWGHTALQYMDVNWISGLDMQSAELARDLLLKSTGAPRPKPSPRPVPLGPTVAPVVLH